MFKRKQDLLVFIVVYMVGCSCSKVVYGRKSERPEKKKGKEVLKWDVECLKVE